VDLKVVGIVSCTSNGCHMIISGMSYTGMLMKMSHWDHGLLALMWSILMIGDYVVALHLVKS
jgi:hypothetical protein